LSTLHNSHYFGELGSLDNLPRTTDAIATSDGLLLYIEKKEFIQVLEDVPEVMRAIISQVILYLRQNLAIVRGAP
ncbi:MAG: cyclic nucleotide-binding domain-containing protein, partial [bacterium]|nr:cyclic nucleotide-binding domain-containing protein [bacterium]